MFLDQLKITFRMIFHLKTALSQRKSVSLCFLDVDLHTISLNHIRSNTIEPFRNGRRFLKYEVLSNRIKQNRGKFSFAGIRR